MVCICVALGLGYRTLIFDKSLQIKPNILLISLDACRADHLSCYGYFRKTSPFIDELASGGTRFENAFINTLATPSSHTTIFTSLYQETHGVGKSDTFSYALPENIIMLQELLRKDGYVTIAVTDTEIFRKMGFDKGFMEFDFTEEISDITSGAEKLLRLLRKYADKNKPIFAFFHTYEIHLPYDPPPNYTKIFGSFESNIKPTALNLLEYANAADKLNKSDMEFLKAMYDGEIRYTDDMLRNVFAELKKIKFFDNYVTIITSDHGEEFGEHGGMSHGGWLYDELLHVPLIMAGNLIPKGKVVNYMTSSIDIMPTILELAGIEIEIPVEGKNLFSGDNSSERQKDMIFAQFGTSLYAVRTQEWKFIETHQQNKIELYHLPTDPHEQKNVSDHYPKIRDKLANIISEWKESRLILGELKPRKINYNEETLNKLRSLGYLQ